jgi:hypothetical protein
MHPQLLDQVSSQAFKVLDIAKAGFFKRDDLLVFLTILCEQCDFGNFKDEEIDEILKQQGAHDLKKINQTSLQRFLKAYFELQTDKYKQMLVH